MFKRRKRKIEGDYIRSSIFGIEDSLVSTTGLIAGIAVATTDKSFIILAGLVAVAVEAISMSAGEFISEETEHDLTHGTDKASPIVGGIVMLVSYALAGLIPIVPILLLPIEYALPTSIVAAAVGLFVLGLVKGKITGKSQIKNGFQVLIVGGIATFFGILVGVLFKV